MAAARGAAAAPREAPESRCPGAGCARRGGAVVCGGARRLVRRLLAGWDGNNRRRGRPDSSGRAGLKFGGGYGATQVAVVRQRGGHVTLVRGRWTRA